MKREIDQAMKRLEKVVPKSVFISLDFEYNRHSSGNIRKIYKVYIASSQGRNYISTEGETAKEATDKALVKFSQQLEEASNDRQTN